MRIETERLIIRDLEQKDKEQIYRIVWQDGPVKFMKDWSENIPSAESLTGYVNWHQSKKDSTDLKECKRYAVALKENDLCIGTVGMGLEDTLGEVEIAYFIDQDYQCRGYATEALTALFNWCMRVSELPWLILTIDEANAPSIAVAEKAGFELFEKRTPLSHKQPNMISESYYYFRKYRKQDV